MIEQIKNISLTICSVSICVCIFEMISPSKKLEKVFNLTLNLFFVFTIFITILSGFNFNKFNFKNNNFDYLKSDNIIDESILNIIDNQIVLSLKNKLKTILKQENINIKDLDLSISSIDKEKINIDEINIYLYEKDKSNNDELIKKVLNEFINTTINLIYI